MSNPSRAVPREDERVVAFPSKSKPLHAVIRDIPARALGGLVECSLLMRIASRCEGHSRGCFESIGSIAAQMNYGERRVKTAFKRLRDLGLIAARVEPGRSGPRAPVYDVVDGAVRAFAVAHPPVRAARAVVDHIPASKTAARSSNDAETAPTRALDCTPRRALDCTPRRALQCPHKTPYGRDNESTPLPPKGGEGRGQGDRAPAVDPLDPGVDAKAKALVALWPRAALDREGAHRVRLSFAVAVQRDGRDPDRILAAARGYLARGDYSGDRGKYAITASKWLATNAEEAVDPEPPASVEEDWTGHVRRWRDHGVWNRPRLGPPPGSPDCRAPADLVAEAVAYVRGPSR